MPHYDNFWHIDAYENITPPVCSTVFVQSKTENQLTSRDAHGYLDSKLSVLSIIPTYQICYRLLSSRQQHNNTCHDVLFHNCQ